MTLQEGQYQLFLLKQKLSQLVVKEQDDQENAKEPSGEPGEVQHAAALRIGTAGGRTALDDVDHMEEEVFLEEGENKLLVLAAAGQLCSWKGPFDHSMECAATPKIRNHHSDHSDVPPLVAEEEHGNEKEKLLPSPEDRKSAINVVSARDAYLSRDELYEIELEGPMDSDDDEEERDDVSERLFEAALDVLDVLGEETELEEEKMGGFTTQFQTRTFAGFFPMEPFTVPPPSKHDEERGDKEEKRHDNNGERECLLDDGNKKAKSWQEHLCHGVDNRRRGSATSMVSSLSDGDDSEVSGDEGNEEIVEGSTRTKKATTTATAARRQAISMCLGDGNVQDNDEVLQDANDVNEDGNDDEEEDEDFQEEDDDLTNRRVVKCVVLVH